MHRTQRKIFLVCSAVSLTGSAFGAPTVGHTNDIFDYLTTTYPIKDWIANAKVEYTRIEHDQPTHHPRFTIEVDNTWKNPIGFRIDQDEQYGSARPRLSTSCLITIIPDPCSEKLALLAGKPALPDRIGVQWQWSRAAIEPAGPQ